MKNVDMLEDLKFIRTVLSELSISEYDYEFGPSYEIAKSRKSLANIKLNRIIRSLKTDTQHIPELTQTNKCLICDEVHSSTQCPYLRVISSI